MARLKTPKERRSRSFLGTPNAPDSRPAERASLPATPSVPHSSSKMHEQAFAVTAAPDRSREVNATRDEVNVSQKSFVLGSDSKSEEPGQGTDCSQKAGLFVKPVQESKPLGSLGTAAPGKATARNGHKFGHDENAMFEMNMTLDIDYLDVYNKDTCPWFMEGIVELQKNKNNFPETSFAADRTLAHIHRRHPQIAFGFGDEDGHNVEAFVAERWESAGLWLDDVSAPCLAVKAWFEDGDEPMLLLYKQNLVASMEDIVTECQWCVLAEEAN